MYIVIEGQDGTGKSTQAKLLVEHLKKQGKETLLMEEPDGDLPQAHDLHDLILVRGKDYHLEGITNVLLFTAARVELWKKLAEPILKRDGYVVSARNWWSTLAYQAYGEGVSKNKIIRITKELLPNRYFMPDLSAILTLSDKERLNRQQIRNKDIETFEAKADDFQQRVNHAYPKIAKDFNVPLVDATPSIPEIQENLLKLFKL